MGEDNKRVAADDAHSARITLTTTQNIKNLLEQAAEVSGLSLNSYVIKIALKGAENASAHKNSIDRNKPGGFS